MDTLNRLGLPSDLLLLLRSYFTNRKQCVRVGNAYSNWEDVRAGVVQGSVLGPLLFCAYISDAVQKFANTLNFCLFADDMLIFQPLNSIADQAILQFNIDMVVSQLKNFGLCVNPAKFCYEIFSQSTSPYVPFAPITVNGSPVDRSLAGLPYLGFILDSGLSWQKKNTDAVVTKCKKAIFALNQKCGHFLSETQKRWLFDSKIKSIFMYGLAVSYPKFMKERRKLERLNYFILRTVTNNFSSPYSCVLDQTGTQSVYEESLSRRIVFARSHYHGKRYFPPGNIIPFQQDSRLRSRYHHGALAPSQPTSMYVDNPSLESSLKLWNTLPRNFIDCRKSDLKLSLKNSDYAFAIDNVAAMRVL